MKKSLILFQTTALLLGVLFTLGSCSDSNNKDHDMAHDTTSIVDTTPIRPAAPAKYTDPQIASIAVTANQVDIDYAKIAKEKASNAEVKKFAQTMMADHQAVIDKAVALVKKLGVTPEDNSLSQSLVSGANDTKAMLNSKTGADFDKAYVDNEVAYHKAAIDIVENTLIPQSSNAELKSLLESALPLFKEHLSHAEMLQSKLNK